MFAFSINQQSLRGSLLALILFCCTASSFYLINDIVDVEADRQHPVKCECPIAAGLVSIPIALGMAFILLGSGRSFTERLANHTDCSWLGDELLSHSMSETARTHRLNLEGL